MLVATSRQPAWLAEVWPSESGRPGCPPVGLGPGHGDVGVGEHMSVNLFDDNDGSSFDWPYTGKRTNRQGSGVGLMGQLDGNAAN